MSLSSPALLAVGLLVAAGLAWAIITVARRRAGALTAAGVTLAHPARETGAWLSVTGIAVLAVAVAGPVASVPVPRPEGTVILAMDVSGSMAATDVTPSRLADAQRAAQSFIQAQPGSIDIGVVAFEEGALTTALPSADHTVAEAAIGRLRVAGGTSLGAAIIASLSAITHKTVSLGPGGAIPDLGYWPSATIVMFSDGQDEGERVSLTTVAKLAEKAGVRVDTVGIGTTAGTTVEVAGYRLFTALNPATLSSIAKTTGGTYYPASDVSLLDRAGSSIDLRLTVANRRIPLAGAFIALALLLLSAGAVMTIVRSARVI
jgi:Ca-activated chloride channel homolog